MLGETREGNYSSDGFRLKLCLTGEGEVGFWSIFRDSKEGC